MSGSLSGALDDATAGRLLGALQAGISASPGLRSITATVAVPGRGSWTWRRLTPGDAPDALFPWASAGKMFTAATVLRLADEGRLSLDDKLEQWSPTAPNAGAITIRDLIQHTSGLFSANEDVVVRRQPHPLSMDEELKVLRRHGAMFCPGERWRYSNSGYALLGDVVQRVEGRPFLEVLQARVVSPLSLSDTAVLAGADPLPPVAAAVSATGETTLPQVPGPAGPVAATSQDMVAFLQALLSGRLLSPQTTAALLRTPFPMFDGGTYYGLGLMLYDVPDADRRLYWIGHSGGAPGVSAIVLWSPAERAFVAVSATGDASSTAFANALLKALAP